MMAETFNGWLAEQLRDPEFAAAYAEASKQVDSEFAAIQVTRSALAQKVIQAVEAEHLDGYIEDEPGEHAADRGRKEDDIAYDNAINHVADALHDLFQREGIELEKSQ
jgi:hypothetical protein